MLFLGSMEFVQRLFLYLSLTALVCLIIGLFKPWVMLWWEDTQNRKKVIRIYGTAALIASIVYLILVLT